MTVMKKHIISINVLNDIAMFASLKYQERDILHPTKDRYYSVDQMINEYRTDEKWIKSMLEAEELTAEGAKILREFNKILKENLIDSDFYVHYVRDAKSGSRTMEDIIYRDPHWVQVKNAAIDCLKRLGVYREIKEWEKEALK